jgi:very-short-patch-repair endonuclease
MRKLTTEEFIEKAKEVHGDLYDYSLVEYEKAKIKISIICKIHGEFEQNPNDHLNGKQGCPKCNGYNKTTEDVIKEFKTIHGNRYDYSLVDFINMTYKVKVICNLHGFFEIDPHHHISSRCGCPKCKSSKGEKIVRDVLTNHNIVFEEQKRFHGCKYKNPLPFDFYLPNHNIVIEYDGEQHFKPHSYSSDQSEETKQKNYEFVKLRDDIKTDYCMENNIKLIRISYKEKDDIYNILNKHLFNLSLSSLDFSE